MATVSSVYAKAIFELSKEKGQLDSLLAEIKSFAEMVEGNKQLKAVLSGSGFDPNARRAVLSGIFQATKVSGVVQKLFELLVARGRIQALPQLVKELETMVEESHGVQMGVVTSAIELSQDEVNVLANTLAKRVGSKVKLSQKVDPALLGGMVATVSGKTYDASLRTQLERFKNELI
jgi:F-type H+-transporting ATPase subunit delta